MTKGVRKPLDKSLIQQFVFGKQDQEKSLPIESQPEVYTEKLTEISNEDSTVLAPDPVHDLASQVVSKFKTTLKEPTTRLTVDLPKSLHHDLALVARTLDTNMGALTRTLLENFLKQVKDNNLLE